MSREKWYITGDMSKVKWSKDGCQHVFRQDDYGKAWRTCAKCGLTLSLREWRVWTVFCQKPAYQRLKDAGQIKERDE